VVRFRRADDARELYDNLVAYYQRPMSTQRLLEVHAFPSVSMPLYLLVVDTFLPHG